jgi:ribonuclease D
MACCDSADCNATLVTPLGLNDVLKVMTNKGINKSMQRQNWTLENDLSQDMRAYGAFDAYVIKYAF